MFDVLMELVREYHGFICFGIGIFVGGMAGMVGTAILVFDRR